MSLAANEPADDSTATEKAMVCLSSFGFACAAFFFSAVVLVPLTGSLANIVDLPPALTGGLILFELFGLTTIAAIYSVALMDGQIASRPKD